MADELSHVPEFISSSSINVMPPKSYIQRTTSFKSEIIIFCRWIFITFRYRPTHTSNAILIHSSELLKANPIMLGLPLEHSNNNNHLQFNYISNARGFCCFWNAKPVERVAAEDERRMRHPITVPTWSPNEKRFLRLKVTDNKRREKNKLKIIATLIVSFVRGTEGAEKKMKRIRSRCDFLICCRSRMN